MSATPAEASAPYCPTTTVMSSPLRALTRKPPTYRQEPEIAAHLQQCANAEYAFVLRSREVVFAKLVEAA